MKLTRLPLAAFSLVALAACGNDATGPMPAHQENPNYVLPSGPRFTGQYLGSGAGVGTDSVMPEDEATPTNGPGTTQIVP